LIPYSPQAQGFFTLAAEGTLERWPLALRRRYATPENLRFAAHLPPIAQQLGCTVNQIVLAYALNQPFPTYPVIGPRNLEQLEDSAAATSVPYPLVQQLMPPPNPDATRSANSEV
jgi:aryl-alcohol dehydrogenase-like predicted oxidoreductase